MELKVIIHKADEGGYWAEIPALKGCVSEGETETEVLSNIKEAAQGWLEVATERFSLSKDDQLAVISL
jgi:predicted RNase H-like HicB family nuclease